MRSSIKPKTVGRPSFRIDPARLRGLREEKSLTQAQTIELVHKHRGRPVPSAAVKQYQRIERSGKTSQTMAGALAAVLGTTVAVLQGEAPVDEGDQFIARLEQHLTDQIARKCNPVLEENLARCGSVTPRDLAIEFLERVESALFDGRQDELGEIALLTGWTVEQLSLPVAVRGHWLISSTHGSSTAEVVFGTGQVFNYITQTIETHVSFHESDTRIVLSEALPKLCVEVPHVRHAALRCTISFRRCMPSSTGLHWVNPSWRDRLHLDSSLRDWAYSTFNFVTDFDGQSYPSDLRQLRLRVEKLEGHGFNSTWQHLSLMKGDLGELTDSRIHNFEAEGASHGLVLNWLVANATNDLKPLLNEWPLEYWKVYEFGWCIRIDLNLPLRLALDSKQTSGPKYQIRLVEELPDGRLRATPWRRSSVEVTSGDLRRKLGMPNT